MDLFNNKKKTPIPSAATAREVAIIAALKNKKDEVQEIMNAIRNAAENGDTQVTLDGAMRETVRKIFQERGYKISLYFHRNESFTKINW